MHQQTQLAALVLVLVQHGVMRTVGFLHTSPVHVATFDALLAARGADVRAVHVVDESLLADARTGGLDAIRERLAGRLTEAAAGVDIVCCTCSTLGGLAEELGAHGSGAAHGAQPASPTTGENPGRIDLPVIRVDRPMARRAVELGERVAVIASVASTVEPSQEVLLDEAARADRPVQLDAHVIEDAWDAFAAGDLDGYERQVADACRRVAATVDVIVLAQASMAGAIARLDDLTAPVLASPALAVEYLTGSAL